MVGSTQEEDEDGSGSGREHTVTLHESDDILTFTKVDSRSVPKFVGNANLKSVRLRDRKSKKFCILSIDGIPVFD